MSKGRSLFSAFLPLMAALGMAPSWAPAEPVLFVTVTPSTGDTVSGTFTHFVSFVGGHQGKATKAPRGGDLYIVYDDGSLRNLTAEAGFGLVAGEEICVREPNVDWSGEKAVFSMAVGGTGHYPAPPSYFQLYEAAGILQGQTVQITKVPGQPEDYNNIQPCYGADGSIIFGSDQPMTRDRRHYPQLDEYESTPTITGLWKLSPDRSTLTLLDHCPSGDFTPIVDSFGRVVFTRWDHLKRDQQADLWIDGVLIEGSTSRARPVTFFNEEADDFDPLAYGHEYFPENGRLHPDRAGSNNPNAIPHAYWDQDFTAGTRKQDFNFFFPWFINHDGTDMEVLNHLGRHEFFGYVETSRDELPDYFRPGSSEVYVRSFNQIRESPIVSGRYYGIDAAEFGTHGAGRIMCFDAPVSMNPDNVPATMRHVTPRTSSQWAGGQALTLFRDPMIRADGSLWASCNGTTDFADNTASDPGAPAPYPMSSNYAFKIRRLVENAQGYFEPSDNLIPDIEKTIEYPTEAFWPPRSVSYSGPMWELFPVSVAARQAPTPTQAEIPAIEEAMLLEQLGGPAGVEGLQRWMKKENLALVVVRDATVRADRQQRYNLKVAWSDHGHGESGAPRDEVGYMQFLDARYVRGYATDQTATEVNPGRRLLARYVEGNDNPPLEAAPLGSVRLGDDGSVAAFVPAGRALTWQLTEPDGDPLVRERYWLTFQPGEIRTCANCHGVNSTDIFGNPPPTNNPQALADLLEWWQDGQAPQFFDAWIVR